MTVLLRAHPTPRSGRREGEPLARSFSAGEWSISADDLPLIVGPRVTASAAQQHAGNRTIRQAVMCVRRQKQAIHVVLIVAA
jgi:hypothetical protein